jgi:putative SOS response-associated peptidase YedK
MCGRYDLNATALELAARFRLALDGVGNAGDKGDGGAGVASNSEVGWHPRYNIAPEQDNPVVVRDAGGHNHLELMRWGLVPAWSKEAKVGYSTINARAETVASKPAFRKPLATQRCLVPATGYFEWAQSRQSAQGKQPYRIGLRGEGTQALERLDEIFAFAGLYDIWEGPGGRELQTYAIVTTRANDALSAIHSRMPVILPSGVEEAWLDGDYKDIENLLSLLQPYPGEGMTVYPVSRLVNSPMNDRPELIEPEPLSRLAA